MTIKWNPDKWDLRFMDMARLVASWSKDPRRKVGAVLVDDARVVLGVGFNGFPRGVVDSEERLNDERIKLKLIVHAEANAIANANRTLNDDVAMYVTSHPCSDCAKLIVQHGIRFVISPPAKTEGKWAEDAEFAKLLMSEGGVEHQILGGLGAYDPKNVTVTFRGEKIEGYASGETIQVNPEQVEEAEKPCFICGHVGTCWPGRCQHVS